MSRSRKVCFFNSSWALSTRQTQVSSEGRRGGSKAELLVWSLLRLDIPPPLHCSGNPPRDTLQNDALCLQRRAWTRLHSSKPALRSRRSFSGLRTKSRVLTDSGMMRPIDLGRALSVGFLEKRAHQGCDCMSGCPLQHTHTRCAVDNMHVDRNHSNQ